MPELTNNDHLVKREVLLGCKTSREFVGKFHNTFAKGAANRLHMPKKLPYLTCIGAWFFQYGS
ncbi:MAG: hypothetical protein JKY99_05630 [Rhizobiales bacterium]|nr:hypothetical protein [Hyphomicrobiales bacterium]